LPATGQVTSMTFGAVTNIPSIVNASSQSNTVSYIPVQQGTALAVQGAFNAVAGATTNVTFFFLKSIDGTNTASTPFASLGEAANGTTTKYWATNWTKDQLAGLKWVALTISNGNTAIITNGTVLYSRPNP
jgi:hypothetical protein